MKSINNSALQQYLKCGYCYYQKYVKGVRPTDTFATARGSILHDLRKVSLTRKIETGNLPSLEEVNDLHIPNSLDREYAPSDDGVRMEPIIRKAAKIDYEHFLTGIEPMWVEKKLSMKLAELDFEIHGTLDLMTTNHKLADLKTTKRSMPASRIHQSNQISTYILLSRSAGIELNDAWYHVLAFSGYNVSVSELRTWRTRDDLLATIRTFQGAFSAIQKGIFLPAPEERSPFE